MGSSASQQERFRQKTFLFFLFISLTTLSGCAGYMQPAKCWLSTEEIASQIDFDAIIANAAQDMCGSTPLFLSNDPADALVVTDFVDIHSYTPNRLGVSLGDKLRTNLSQICAVPVRQTELMKNFRLNSKGLTALTRQPEELLSKSFEAKNAIIGTQDWQGNRLTLTIKSISLSDTLIQKSISREVHWSCKQDPLGNSKFEWHLQK